MRKIVIIRLLVLFSILNLFSCTKHEEIEDTTFQIGNILCSDGSVLHPSLFAKSGKKAVGIIFWTNKGEDHISDYGYAVALHDIGRDIMIEKEDDISNVTENENDYNGASNTAAIIAYAKAEDVESPAAKLAVEYSPMGMFGWYLPSVAQMRSLWINKDRVYKSLILVEGEIFNDWYWTSTEDGNGKDTPAMYMMSCAINEGRFTPSSKLKENKVRPIISIR